MKSRVGFGEDDDDRGRHRKNWKPGVGALIGGRPDSAPVNELWCRGDNDEVQSRKTDSWRPGEDSTRDGFSWLQLFWRGRGEANIKEQGSSMEHRTMRRREQQVMIDLLKIFKAL